MERRQIEYFLAVIDHGGFTNAARKLHTAQPSLSHSIRTLEKELGGPLFHRLPHGVVLTPAGEALEGPARQILRDLATAHSSVREVLGLAGGTLDIVSQTSLAVDPLAALLGQFRVAHPRVLVRVIAPETSAGVVEYVLTGRSEVGLMEAGADPRGLAVTELAQQELLAVLPSGSTRADPLPLTELATLDLITTPRGTATRLIVEDALRGLGIEPRVVVETAHRAMIVPLVLAGAGAALLPRSMAESAEQQGAVIAAIQPRLVRRGQMVRRPGPLSPAAAKFADLLR